MPARTLDTALAGGAVSSPFWLHGLTDVGQAVLVLIGIVVGLLRVEALLRARRRDRAIDPSAFD
ncbi:hypothetical protein ACIU1J_27735 [Azospirillum doebereinerae]|uniref:hypothetical protein n=1 Tax=Azospirillum doebereinerae TaxID=92933 RepID=UPI001EE51C19|nr:hypothetical protein [Azospirillum doebereinerae]MCG5241411.1 hypothetical protein [Azospirillum doebereinerae]